MRHTQLRRGQLTAGPMPAGLTPGEDIERRQAERDHREQPQADRPARRVSSMPFAFPGWCRTAATTANTSATANTIPRAVPPATPPLQRSRPGRHPRECWYRHSRDHPGRPGVGSVARRGRPRVPHRTGKHSHARTSSWTHPRAASRAAGALPPLGIVGQGVAGSNQWSTWHRAEMTLRCAELADSVSRHRWPCLPGGCRPVEARPRRPVPRVPPYPYGSRVGTAVGQRSEWRPSRHSCRTGRSPVRQGCP